MYLITCDCKKNSSRYIKKQDSASLQKSFFIHLQCCFLVFFFSNLGLIYAAASLGVAAGYMLGAQTLSIYTDFDKVDPEEYVAKRFIILF